MTLVNIPTDGFLISCKGVPGCIPLPSEHQQVFGVAIFFVGDVAKTMTKDVATSSTPGGLAPDAFLPFAEMNMCFYFPPLVLQESITAGHVFACFSQKHL